MESFLHVHGLLDTPRFLLSPQCISHKKHLTHTPSKSRVKLPEKPGGPSGPNTVTRCFPAIKRASQRTEHHMQKEGLSLATTLFVYTPWNHGCGKPPIFVKGRKRVIQNAIVHLRGDFRECTMAFNRLITDIPLDPRV